MGRFDKGWIKIYRKLLTSDISTNLSRLGLLVKLICMANRSETTISWRGQPKRIQPGTVVTSIRELASEGECDKNTVQKHLRYLALRDTISIEKSKNGVLISIVNFHEYQELDAEGSPQGHHAISHGVSHGVTHIGEEEKERRGEVGTELKAAASVSGPVAELESPDEDVLFALSQVKQKTQRDWLALYPEPLWIKRELKKAVMYYRANSKKTPKKPAGWSRAFTTWLDRGWEWRAKRTPGIAGSAAGSGQIQIEVFNPSDEVGVP